MVPRAMAGLVPRGTRRVPRMQLRGFSEVLEAGFALQCHVVCHTLLRLMLPAFCTLVSPTDVHRSSGPQRLSQHDSECEGSEEQQL
jgi:hypothetical protein